ncbi:MAG: hypothetical protein ABEH47_07200 [Haloferacaceae archaeon]
MFDGDELAGVVGQFGALTREELGRALEELAFKRGETVADPDAAVEDALTDLHLVAFERDGTELLAPGPAAFPALPDGAEDLPHILDVEERSVDRAALVDPAERRLRSAAANAAAAGDRERIERLLDATYDLETWASDADVASVRERLDAALDDLDGAPDGV